MKYSCAIVVGYMASGNYTLHIVLHLVMVVMVTCDVMVTRFVWSVVLILRHLTDMPWQAQLDGLGILRHLTDMTWF